MQVIKQIEEWAINKGLDNPDFAEKQWLKVIEEIGEVAACLTKNKTEELKLELGDVGVTLIILNMQTLSHKLHTPDPDTLSTIEAIEGILSCVSTSGLGVNTAWMYLDDLCTSLNLTLEECLETAYTKIANRTGTVIDGNFVKD